MLTVYVGRTYYRRRKEVLLCLFHRTKEIKTQSPRCTPASFQIFIRHGQNHLLLQFVEGVDTFSTRLRSALRQCRWSWAGTTPRLVCGHTTIPSPASQARDWAPPSSAADLNCTWTVTSSWTHSVLITPTDLPCRNSLKYNWAIYWILSGWARHWRGICFVSLLYSNCCSSYHC